MADEASTRILEGLYCSVPGEKPGKARRIRMEAPNLAVGLHSGTFESVFALECCAGGESEVA
jgi:hypothetical protein